MAIVMYRRLKPKKFDQSHQTPFHILNMWVAGDETNAYDAFSASMFWGYKCACAIKFHVAQLDEYTYENGVQFEIKSLKLVGLSFFIVSEDIISILLDQNFATGMVLESMW